MYPSVEKYSRMHPQTLCQSLRSPCLGLWRCYRLFCIGCSSVRDVLLSRARIGGRQKRSSEDRPVACVGFRV